MVKLSEIPFSKLKAGDKLVSAINTSGHILDVYHDNRYKIDDVDGDMIEMAWNNGNISLVQHYCCDKIEFIGE